MTGASSRRSRMDPYIGEVVGGRYQLLHRLASGGMGAVYIGRGVGAGGFERRFAVKLLHPHLAEHEKFVAMFLDEARLAARIHHPNVVPTLDVFEEEGDHFLVMDYVDGLDARPADPRGAQAKAEIPAPVVLRITLDALAGLVAAHELKDKEGRPLNLVHRDISPQNILVGADGISRLTDFGVAKAANQLHVTQGAEFKGKLAYAAPEQIEKSVVEQRSDVFAIAVVAWEALAQRRLFKAEDKMAIRRMVLAGEYPALSSAEPELAAFDDVIARAMAPEVENRTRSARLLADELEAASPVIATPAQVAKWVRAIGVEPLSEREKEIRAAESQVPYPETTGGSGASGRSSGPAYTAAASTGGPETSEVVPAGATLPTAAGTPASLRPSPPEDPWTGLVPLSSPHAVGPAPSGPVLPPRFDTMSDAPTTEIAPRRMLPFVLIACAVLAAAIGVAIFLVTNANRTAPAPMPEQRVRVLSDPGDEPGTEPPAGAHVVEPTPPVPTPMPATRPTPAPTAPTMAFAHEPAPATIEDEDPSGTSMRAPHGTHMRTSMDSEEDVPENPYQNL